MYFTKIKNQGIPHLHRHQHDQGGGGGQRLTHAPPHLLQQEYLQSHPGEKEVYEQSHEQKGTS